MKHFLTFVGLVWMVVGCGPTDGSGGGAHGGGGSAGASGGTIDASFHIDLADVPGYDSTDPIEDQYLSVVNYLRGLDITCNDAQGLSGPVGIDLRNDPHLQASAREHSEDMRISGHYGHEGSGTTSDTTGQALGHASTPPERMEHNGYSGSITGENIAIMSSMPNPPESDAWVRAMEGWMTSTHGHCSNIMNPAFTDFGMYESRTTSPDAEGYYHVYWTQNFGGN
jgi:uncharacterized protein YkwD